MNLFPRFSAHAVAPLLTSVCLCSAACDNSSPGKEPVKKTSTAAAQSSSQASTKTKQGAAQEARQDAAKKRAEMMKKLQKARGERPVPAKPVKKIQPTPGDPEKGDFTVKEATAGLSGDGALVADIVTDAGPLSCELLEDKAPITVANFVGLARGLRPWKKDGKWVKQPLYDGTKFHRIIKGFMIQGGDPAGNGSGGPGYVIPDEIWENARHNKIGQLCMANRGPNTNGSQFFVMDGVASHLDGGYTIFGQCSPESVVKALSGTKVRGQSPETAPKIKKVTVKRQPRTAKPPSTATTQAAKAIPAASSLAPKK